MHNMTHEIERYEIKSNETNRNPIKYIQYVHDTEDNNFGTFHIWIDRVLISKNKVWHQQIMDGLDLTVFILIFIWALSRIYTTNTHTYAVTGENERGHAPQRNRHHLELTKELQYTHTTNQHSTYNFIHLN